MREIGRTRLRHTGSRSASMASLWSPCRTRGAFLLVLLIGTALSAEACQQVHHFNLEEIPGSPLTLVHGLHLRGASLYSLQPASHVEVFMTGPGEPYMSSMERSFYESTRPDQVQGEGEEEEPLERALQLLSLVHFQTRILDIGSIHSELRRAALQKLQSELHWRQMQEEAAAELSAREAESRQAETSSVADMWDSIKKSVTAKLQAFREEPEMAAVKRQQQQGLDGVDDLFGLFHRAQEVASSSFFGCMAVGVAIALLTSLVFSCLMTLCQCPDEEETTLLVVSAPETVSTPLLTTREHRDVPEASEEGVIENPLIALQAYQPPQIHVTSEK